ncbi:MAG: MarR family transcriptional regulator [Candidatus Thorarchaeota archaeon]|nr:MarR family transcriptional regulator [Candidatus Thorarchaeota archaeon]
MPIGSAMTSPDSVSARLTLKLAGILQDVRGEWIRRLDQYFNQIESLIAGEWFDTADLGGLMKESRLAAREALEGLSSDLCAQLVHESSGLIARYETERAQLVDRINLLTEDINHALCCDDDDIRRQNEVLRSIVRALPEFTLLRIIEDAQAMDLNTLFEVSQTKKTTVTRHLKSLQEGGYVRVDGKGRAKRVVFLSAPWSTQRCGSQQRTRSSIPQCETGLSP